MKLSVFAVRDIKTDQFGNPMFLVTKLHAIRSFSDEVNRKDPNNLIHNHAEDFELFALGEFDTTTGLFTTGTPLSVATAKELLSK